MKTRELVYMVLDMCKLASDDSYFTEEHVEWLLGKNRSFLLNREQERLKRELSYENKQTICVDLEPVSVFDGDDCGISFTKSVQKIPELISGTVPKVSTVSLLSGNISFVSFEKFRYVNYNKYLKNIIFAAVGPDNHVYIKGSNNTFQYLEKIMVSGIFDDFIKAAQLSCDESGESITCDSLDMEFPIESYLVPELVDRVLRELLGAAWRGRDKVNNADDNLSDIANYINRYLKRGDLRDNINGKQ